MNPLDQPFALLTIVSSLLVLDAPAGLQVVWLLALVAVRWWMGATPAPRRASTHR